MQTSALSERIETLYGVVDWRSATGLLHVAAIAGSPACAIAIGSSAPTSPTDRFVLGLARARADAIVTTGAILRAEPELVHRYAEDEEGQVALARWRERVLGKHASPGVVVLSESGDFPIEHPALVAARAGLVWTTPAGRVRLGGQNVARLSIEGPEEPGEPLRASVLRAIARARELLGARTVLVEAGPTVSRTLYPTPATSSPGNNRVDRVEGEWIDELLLSRFAGDLKAPAVGPPFVPQARISARFGRANSVRHIEEASGAWSFERHRVTG